MTGSSGSKRCACIAICVALLRAQGSAAEQKFAFTVQLTFSPKAAAKLADLHESLIISASYSGDLRPAQRVTPIRSAASRSASKTLKSPENRTQPASLDRRSTAIIWHGSTAQCTLTSMSTRPAAAARITSSPATSSTVARRSSPAGRAPLLAHRRRSGNETQRIAEAPDGKILEHP